MLDDKKEEEDKVEMVDLTLGSMVEIHIKPTEGNKEEKTCYGVVKWVGFHEGIKHKLVGLELVSIVGRCTIIIIFKNYFYRKSRLWWAE